MEASRKGVGASRQDALRDGSVNGAGDRSRAEKGPQDPRSTINFCFTLAVHYDDGDQADDDYWTGNNIWAKARGMNAKIVQVGGGYPVVFDGALNWTGSDRGCTGPRSGLLQGDFDFQLTSSGRVRNMNIDVKAADSGYRAKYEWRDYGGSGRNTSDVPVGTRGNAYAAVAYAAAVHNGGVSGNLVVETRSSRGSSVGGDISMDDAKLFLAPGDEQMKRVIAHEMGHVVGGWGSELNHGDAIDYSFTDAATGLCPSAADGHTLQSREYSSTAMAEGWANFYAADIWNSHDQDDCSLAFFGTAVDCEAGQWGYPVKYMENKCENLFNVVVFDGFGVELDWMRAFWDVHTDGNQSADHAALHSWMARQSWGKCDGYFWLNDSANEIGGELDHDWDNAKTRNGVDWWANYCG